MRKLLPTVAVLFSATLALTACGGDKFDGDPLPYSGTGGTDQDALAIQALIEHVSSARGKNFEDLINTAVCPERAEWMRENPNTPTEDDDKDLPPGKPVLLHTIFFESADFAVAEYESGIEGNRTANTLSWEAFKQLDEDSDFSGWCVDDLTP